MRITTEVHDIDIPMLSYVLNGVKDNMYGISDSEVLNAVNFLRGIGKQIMENYEAGRYSATNVNEFNEFMEENNWTIDEGRKVEEEMAEDVRAKVELIRSSSLLLLADKQEKEALNTILNVIEHSLDKQYPFHDNRPEQVSAVPYIYRTTYTLPDSDPDVVHHSFIVAHSREELLETALERNLGETIDDNPIKPGDFRDPRVMPKVSEMVNLGTTGMLSWAIKLAFIDYKKHPEDVAEILGPEGTISDIIRYIEEYNTGKISYSSMIDKCTPLYQIMASDGMIIPEDFD